MNNHIYHILSQWMQLREHSNWVLGVVSRTRGSVYRKAGAIMLISEQGDHLGLVSGGCLEADLRQQARRVFEFNQPRTVEYDSEDVGGLAWKLGIGCGGAAEITLLPCNVHNNYMELVVLYEVLSRHGKCNYLLNTRTGSSAVKKELHDVKSTSEVLNIPLSAPPKLAVFGAGIDMVPVVNMASLLGWQVVVVDERVANKKPEKFPHASDVICCKTEDLPQVLHDSIDAAIVATHNLQLDAKAIKWLDNSSAKYVGLLGPLARKEKVVEAADKVISKLSYPLFGPMGLDIGGELPESIALSALAECHSVLFGKQLGMEQLVGVGASNSTSMVIAQNG